MTSPAFRVQMCDACCCGTTEKHPNIDHQRQRDEIAAAATAGGGTSRVVDCLGECHASNVVVVLQPEREAEWLGWIVDDTILSDVCDWLRDGAPTLPEQIAPHRIDRTQPVEQTG